MKGPTKRIFLEGCSRRVILSLRTISHPNTGSDAYWWMAVGASKIYIDNGVNTGRIPGPLRWNGGYGGYKQVELYVKCDN